MLNRVVLIGRLTRDPELRFTPNGKAVCQFTLAVDRQYTDQNGEKQADFINIVVWGKAAESCTQYLAKGKLAAVDGRLQVRTYFAQKDGSKRWVTEVVAETVRFLSFKSSESESAPPDEEDCYDDYYAEDSVQGDLPF